MPDQFKQTLRCVIRQVRKRLSCSYQQAVSKVICTEIQALSEYQSAKRIALYRSNQGEINLERIWHCAHSQGKICYFPVLNENLTLSFLPASQDTEFVVNRFGILEPNVPLSKKVSPALLDIVFLPLVAFDRYGTRMGMGKGYYDRTLGDHRPKSLIGVAYEFQRQTFIEPQNWDVPLTAIITEQQMYWSRS